MFEWTPYVTPIIWKQTDLQYCRHRGARFAQPPQARSRPQGSLGTELRPISNSRVRGGSTVVNTATAYPARTICIPWGCIRCNLESDPTLKLLAPLGVPQVEWNCSMGHIFDTPTITYQWYLLCMDGYLLSLLKLASSLQQVRPDQAFPFLPRELALKPWTTHTSKFSILLVSSRPILTPCSFAKWWYCQKVQACFSKAFNFAFLRKKKPITWLFKLAC